MQMFIWPVFKTLWFLRVFFW